MARSNGYRNRPFERFFTRYTTWLLRRSFAVIWLANDASPLPSGGYVAAANHSSWWDGFVGGFLHKRADRARDFAVMMSEPELRRFPFFAWLGAFPIDTATLRSAYRAVVRASEEARAGAGVWIFPQGEIARGSGWPPFRGGFALAAVRAGVPVVPVAIRYAMRERQRPEVFVHVGEPMKGSETRSLAAACEAAVRDLLATIDECIANDVVESTFAPVLRENLGIDARISAAFAAIGRR